jgi:hypothetical protein
LTSLVAGLAQQGAERALGVAALVLERLVDRAEQEGMRRYEEEQVAAGSEPLAERRERGGVVGDVLEHVEADGRVVGARGCIAHLALDHGRACRPATGLGGQRRVGLDGDDLPALGELRRERPDSRAHLEHARAEIRAGTVEQPLVVPAGCGHPVE